MLFHWQSKSVINLIVFGDSSSGKSTLIDLLFLVGQNNYDLKRPSEANLPEFVPVKRIEAPFSRAKVWTTTTKGRDGYGSSRTSENWKVTICETRTLRGWYPKFRSSTEKTEARFYLAFVVDCFRMREENYRKNQYTELHGTLAEGKDDEHLCIALILTHQDQKGALSTKEVLQSFKLVEVKIPDRQENCPYYGGPVLFAVTNINGTIQEPKGRVNEVTEMQHLIHRWLFTQPSSRPHFGIRFSKRSILAKLPGAEDRHNVGVWKKFISMFWFFKIHLVFFFSSIENISNKKRKRISFRIELEERLDSSRQRLRPLWFPLQSKFLLFFIVTAWEEIVWRKFWPFNVSSSSEEFALSASAMTRTPSSWMGLPCCCSKTVASEKRKTKQTSFTGEIQMLDGTSLELESVSHDVGGIESNLAICLKGNETEKPQVLAAYSSNWGAAGRNSLSTTLQSRWHLLHQVDCLQQMRVKWMIGNFSGRRGSYQQGPTLSGKNSLSTLLQELWQLARQVHFLMRRKGCWLGRVRRSSLYLRDPNGGETNFFSVSQQWLWHRQIRFDCLSNGEKINSKARKSSLCGHLKEGGLEEKHFVPVPWRVRWLHSLWFRSLCVSCETTITSEWNQQNTAKIQFLESGIEGE